MEILNKNHNSYLGFDSITDFLQTVFGFKHKATNLYLAAVAGLTSFITNYIWDDAGAVYFMFFLVGADFITGIYKAKKNKVFSSTRFPRAFVSLLVYCLLLAVSWNSANYSSLFTWLPGLMYGGIISTLLLSLIENLQSSGLLKFDLLQLIKDKLKNIIK